MYINYCSRNVLCTSIIVINMVDFSVLQNYIENTVSQLKFNGIEKINLNFCVELSTKKKK